HGLAYFQNSLQNYYLEGTDESIAIINALGLRQRITISRVTATNRPKKQWTTSYAFAGFWNDVEACAWLQASLIRAAPNHFETVFGADGGASWDFFYEGESGTQGVYVFLVAPPPSLVSLVTAHQDLMAAMLLSNARGYLALQEQTIDVTPPAWTQPGAVYYGGSPLCVFGNPQPYVQASFGYYDDCGTTRQLAVCCMVPTKSMKFWR
ncbi:hypothetical protein As57867_003688, partial [Aphanomyces stellatus]